VPDLPRRQLALYAAGLLVIVLLGARYLAGAGGAEEAASPPGEPAVRVEAPDDGGERVVVHVAGAVRRPGVYRLRAGERVDDAVARAGGPTRRADLGAVNLAAKVEDGRQVLVPERAPRGRAAVAAGAAAAPGAAAAAGSAAAAGVPVPPLNLNTATLEQLDTLDGVGPVTAQKILEHREANGGFGSVEELGEIPGIGEKRLAALREQVRV